MKKISFLLALSLACNAAQAQTVEYKLLATKYEEHNGRKKPVYKNEDLIYALVKAPASPKVQISLQGKIFEYPSEPLPLGISPTYSLVKLAPQNFDPVKFIPHREFGAWIAGFYLFKGSGRIELDELILDLDYSTSRYKVEMFADLDPKVERRGLELQLQQLLEDSTNASYLLRSMRQNKAAAQENAQNAETKFQTELYSQSKRAEDWRQLNQINQQISRLLVEFQQTQNQKLGYQIADLTSKRDQLFKELSAAEPKLLDLYQNNQLAYVQQLSNGMDIERLEKKIQSLSQQIGSVRRLLLQLGQ